MKQARSATRVADGSRVNVIAAAAFARRSGTHHPEIPPRPLDPRQTGEVRLDHAGRGRLLEIIGHCRINTIVPSGGTGSGKTTLLNCLTNYIDRTERVITCEDAAELQLQQPHVVRLETRPPNLEGVGAVTMRDLVRNCLRMRPERIIVGEVRGPEAFDLLQAMNTGHDGSMGTIHANNPRECVSRMENMIAMGGYNLPAKTVREHIAGAIQVVVQAARLRDGSRKITPYLRSAGHGRRGGHIAGSLRLRNNRRGRQGRINRPASFHTGLRPGFWDRVRYFGKERDLAEAMEAGSA